MHVQSCFSIVKKIHMSKRKKWHFRLALLGLSQNFTSGENFFDPYMIAIYGFDVTSDVHLNGTRIFLLHDTVFPQKGIFCQRIFDFSILPEANLCMLEKSFCLMICSTFKSLSHRQLSFRLSNTVFLLEKIFF